MLTWLTSFKCPSHGQDTCLSVCPGVAARGKRQEVSGCLCFNVHFLKPDNYANQLSTCRDIGDLIVSVFILSRGSSSGVFTRKL